VQRRIVRTIDSLLAAVYLAYAGPYDASPSSAFGHLFLVFAQTPDTSMASAEVVTILADTRGDGALTTWWRGLAGGYRVQVVRRPFHEQAREYGLLEDRPLWFRALDLSRAERARLLEGLKRTDGARLPYRFLTRNCASYLQQLLADATGAVPSPSGVVSPADVFALVGRSRLSVRVTRRPSSSMLVQARAAARRGLMPVARIHHDRWQASLRDHAWIDSLDSPARALMLEAVRLHMATMRVPLDPVAREGLRRLRLSMASETDGDESEPRAGDRAAPAARRASGPIRADDGPVEPSHDYLRLSAGLLGDVGEPTRAVMQVRPAMHALTDPEGTHARGSVLEVATISVSVGPAEGDVRLEQLTLFSQRVLVPGSWLRPRRAWALELLGRRGGPIDPGDLHAELRTGLGAARHVGGRAHGYALVTASAYASPGGRTATGPGMEVGVNTWPATWLRIATRVNLERPFGASRPLWYMAEATARFDLSAQRGLALHYQAQPGLRRIAATVEVRR